MSTVCGPLSVKLEIIHFIRYISMSVLIYILEYCYYMKKKIVGCKNMSMYRK